MRSAKLFSLFGNSPDIDEVFFLQIKDQQLEEVIKYTMNFVPLEIIIVFESGGLTKL